jgi:hypothetical protein
MGACGLKPGFEMAVCAVQTVADIVRKLLAGFVSNRLPCRMAPPFGPAGILASSGMGMVTGDAGDNAGKLAVAHSVRAAK